MRRVGFLIWKELIELKADPRLFGIVVAARNPVSEESHAAGA